MVTSCNKTFEVTPSYLSGKTFIKKGYAEERMSSEDIKSNPDLAKSIVTSIASFDFINESQVKVSYWNLGQDELSETVNYSIINNQIRTSLGSMQGIFGIIQELKDSETLICKNNYNYQLKLVKEE